MKYQRLFEIRVEHAAYPGGRCADLRLMPRAGHPSGERALARHRMLTRPRPQGIEVVLPVTDSVPARPLLRLPEGLVIGFDVQIGGPAFASLTDLESWRALRVPTYKAEAAGAAAAGAERRLRLAEGAASAAERLAPETAARVVIDGLREEWLAAPPTFRLELAAQQMPWIYYALTRKAAGEPPRIQDDKGKPALKFDVAQLTARNTANDPRGRALLASYPEQRCFRLVSKRAVPLQIGARAALALYAGNELVIGELGAPSWQQSTAVTLKAGATRHCLFRVVQF